MHFDKGLKVLNVGFTNDVPLYLSREHAVFQPEFFARFGFIKAFQRALVNR